MEASGVTSFTGTPITLFGWVNRPSAGSFGRKYLLIGSSDSEHWQIGEDESGSSGKGAAYQYHGGFNSGAVAAAGGVVTNNVWHFVCGPFNTYAVGRSVTVDGGNTGTKTSSMTDPSPINKIHVNGRMSDNASGIGGMFAHFGAIPRALDALEQAYLGTGGNANYIPHTGGSYYYGDQTATETDKWGSNNLTVTGTSAGSSDPDLATYWTAAAFGNQAATQGTLIASVDLTTKFSDVHSAFTCSLLQIGTKSQVSTANGAAASASNLLTAADASSFSAGDYMGVNTSALIQVLRVSSNTLLLASSVTWANGDAVYRATTSAKTFSFGALVSGTTYGNKTPAAGDVGTHANLIIRAACSNNAALIADSAPFSLTIASSGAAPSFSAGPTLTGPTTDGYAFGATCNQTATWHLGVYIKGSATPSAANLKAGAGTGFVAHFTQSLTAATPGTLSATGLDLPIYDIHHLVTNGSGDSAITSFTAQQKLPPAGKQYVPITLPTISAITKANPAQVTANGHGLTTGYWAEVYGVSGMTEINNTFATVTVIDANTVTLDGIDSTGFSTYTSGGNLTWGQSAYNGASAVAVTGDIGIWDSVTTPGGYPLTPTAAGTPAYAANGDAKRQTFAVDFYDVSVGAVVGVTTDYDNNVAPNVPAVLAPVFVLANQAITPISIAALATDPQNDALTVSAVTSLPTGLTLSSGSLSGTVSTVGTYPVTFAWANASGENAQSTLQIQVGYPVEPSILGLTQQQAADALATAFFGAQFATQDDPNPAGPAASGLVIGQSPPAGSSLPPGTVVNVTLSSGNALVTTPTVSIQRAVDSDKILYGVPPPPLFSPVSGANRFEDVEVCLAGPSDLPGQIYRFFRLASDSKIVDLGLLNDANPSNSSYSGGLFKEDGTPVLRGADSALFRAISLDGVRATWNSVYSPAIAGISSLANSNKALWQLLGYPADPKQVWLVGMTAVTPGTTGGAIVLRVSYTR